MKNNDTFDGVPQYPEGKIVVVSGGVKPLHLFLAVAVLLVGNAVLLSSIFFDFPELSINVGDTDVVFAGTQSFGRIAPTSSMLPTVSSADRVMYSGDTSSIGVGDIVKYRHGVDEEEQYVLHRVIFVINKTELEKESAEIFYVMKGDNNPYPDQFLVKQKDVVDVVEQIKFG